MPEAGGGMGRSRGGHGAEGGEQAAWGRMGGGRGQGRGCVGGFNGTLWTDLMVIIIEVIGCSLTIDTTIATAVRWGYRG